MNKIPTLIQPELPLVVNPDIVGMEHDRSESYVRVCFPDGEIQILDSRVMFKPVALWNLLFRWAKAHIDAVRGEGAESEDPGGE